MLQAVTSSEQQSCCAWVRVGGRLFCWSAACLTTAVLNEHDGAKVPWFGFGNRRIIFIDSFTTVWRTKHKTLGKGPDLFGVVKIKTSHSLQITLKNSSVNGNIRVFAKVRL